MSAATVTASSIAVLGILTSVLLAACTTITDSDLDAPVVRTLKSDPMPPLEAVPFDRIGNNRIGFTRFVRGADGIHGLYIIDGTAGTSTSYLGGNVFSNAVISPDGSTVALAMWSTLATAWDIFTAALAGGEAHRLSDTEGNWEGPPSWTPDGEVVYAEHVGFRSYLRRGAPLGGVAARVFAFPQRGDTIWDIGMRLGMATSGLIAFTHYDALMLLDPASAEVRVAFEAKPVDSLTGVWVHAPAWSPNGQELVFLEVASGDDGYVDEVRVHRLDPGAGDLTHLATVFSISPAHSWGIGQEPFSACWARDGETVFFTAPLDGAYRVLAVPAGGGDVMTITSPADGSDAGVSCL
jgi:Tol biopolymer transport system component